MELPKDLRFISLKYAGLCRACATSLKAGEQAHWSPSSKDVWCIDCAGEVSSVQVASDSVVGSSQNAIKNISPNSASALNPAANRSHTPFAAQAQLIDQLAKRQFGQDFLSDIGFVSGTAHRLQGDEREAIVLSSVLSPGMSKSGIRWVEKERNLLNVAVSRARRALIVLGHPFIGDLGSPTLASLRVYLCDEMIQKEGVTQPSADFRTDSRSEQLLLDAMQIRDLSPYAKLQVEGYELDFALLEQGIKLNIEVDGDQHLDARGRQRRQDIARDRVLFNLDWTVLRIAAMPRRN